MSSLVFHQYIHRNTPYQHELAECRFWIEHPLLRQKSQQEIYSKSHYCPVCKHRMTWSSDHMYFIWFECTREDCWGDKKVYL